VAARSAGRAFRYARIGSAASDLRDTMAAKNGAGLAAPQIGVPLQVVIFGMEHNSRYPDAEPSPIPNSSTPRSHPCRRTSKRTGKAACRFRGCAASCRVMRVCATRAATPTGGRSVATSPPSTLGGAARVRSFAGHSVPDANA
jgi:hypothetical protein